MPITLQSLPINAAVPLVRQDALRRIVDHIAMQRTCGVPTNLVFICTHNARRSHLSHIWATVAADYYKVPNILLWSGGTEVTCMNERVADTLLRSGFKIRKGEGDNPVYEVNFSGRNEPIKCFSKRWDDPSIPHDDFAAIMVCSSAETACPFIPGATARILVSYEDPKEAEGTPEEELIYDKRSKQIAEEMFWVFKQLHNGEE